MNDQFDELAKGMAQSVTRRGALKKFGVGLAGMALATLGLASKAEAAGHRGQCLAACRKRCAEIYGAKTPGYNASYASCAAGCYNY